MASIIEGVRARPATWRLFVLPADGMPLAARENVTRHRRGLLESVLPPIAWGLERLGLEHLDHEIMSYMLLACFEQAISMALTDPERFTVERLLRFAGDFLATRGLAAPRSQ
jgi:hypothetical protein